MTTFALIFLTLWIVVGAITAATLGVLLKRALVAGWRELQVRYYIWRIEKYLKREPQEPTLRLVKNEMYKRL